MNLKARLENANKTKMTPVQVADFYNENVKVSTSSEAVNKTFVFMASTIYTRALNMPEVANVVQNLDEDRANGVFNSISKLMVIVEKAKQAELIQWSFLLIADYQQSGILSDEAMSLRALNGKAPAINNGKGSVDVFVAKFHIRVFLTTKLATELEIDHHVISTLQSITANANLFRQRQGFRNKADLPDQSWKAGWSDVAQSLLVLIEELRATVLLNSTNAHGCFSVNSAWRA